MIIIVDKNEADVNKSVLASLKKHFTNVIIANLPHHDYGGITVTSGDINIPLDDGSLLAIERKTPTDFLNSIPNRHIFNQVEVMAQHSKFYALIITGKLSYTSKTDMVKADDRFTEWTGASVRAARNAIMASGCPIIDCPESDYCNQIVEVYNLFNKPNKHQGIVKNRLITFPPVDERIQLLAQFPGVGLKLAESLLCFAGMMDNNADSDGYGTLASALHWLSILVQIDKSSRPEGWGAKKILTFRKFMGLESNQYIAINSEKQEMNTNDNEEKEPF